MNIAMIIPSLSNTGPGIVVQELCRGLMAKGHTCKVFYFDDIVELEMPCPVERISFWHSLHFAEWDVVHSHMLRPDLYVRIHSFFLTAKTKFISTLHNPISYEAFRTGFGRIQSAVGSWAWKFALTAFDNIVVLNQYTYSTISGVRRHKLSVIFNGRDIIPMECEYSDKEACKIKELSEKYIIIGTISSITRRKGLDQIVKALPQLPNYAFVAVGDGTELDNLKLLAQKESVLNRCYFVGYKKNAVPYLSLFDIFLMCSHSEGFPLALIEAAAYSKPTVLSDIPILKSVISSSDVVFYELDNIKSLAEKIFEISEKLPYYAQKIHNYYLTHLTRDIMINNYEQLYGACKNSK